MTAASRPGVVSSRVRVVIVVVVPHDSSFE